MLLVGVCGAGGSHPARAALLFPSVVERIEGVRLDVAPSRDAGGAPAPAFRVEAGDVELFGIAGLRVSGARASALHHAVLASASIASVASPVGSQLRAVAEVGAASPGAWQGAARVGVERLALDGVPRAQWLVTGVVSRVDVGPVTALADVDVVSGQGRYDTSVTLALRVRAGPAGLVGSARIEGDRFVGAGLAVSARVHPFLCLLAGYDDGSAAMRAGAVVTWRAIEVATGLFQHPVLGTSQGVTVACTH